MMKLAHKTDRIASEVIRIISKTKSLKPSRLREHSDLTRDFGFDNLDVVDVIQLLIKGRKQTMKNGMVSGRKSLK